MRNLILLTAAVSGLLTGCAITGSSAEGGTIVLIVSTDGPDPDPDGYLFNDGPIAVNDTLVLEHHQGDHDWWLPTLIGGVAPNCAFEGGERRMFSVRGGEVVTIRIRITCQPGARLRVVPTGSGGGAAGASFLIALENGQSATLSLATPTELGGLPGGSQRLTISLVAGWCDLVGSISRTAQLTPGTTTVLPLQFTCPVTPDPTIAFAALVGPSCCSPTGISTVSRHGTVVHRWEVEGILHWSLGWSGDGEWLTYATSRQGHSEFWRVRPDGTMTGRLADGGDEWGLSPDGRLVATIVGQPGQHLVITTTTGDTLRRLNLGGISIGLLGEWSPDSRRIAIEHQGNVGTLDVQTGAVAWLTTDGLPWSAGVGHRYSTLRWARSGTRIVFLRMPNSGAWIPDSRMYTAAAEGQAAAEVLDGHSGTGVLGERFLSVDGASLFSGITSLSPPTARAQRYHFASRQTEVLGAVPLARGQLSGNETRTVYLHWPDGLIVDRITGGERRVVATGQVLAGPGSTAAAHKLLWRPAIN